MSWNQGEATKDHLEVSRDESTAFSKMDSKVKISGVAELYDSDGNLRLIPVPTNDPNDPLRHPEWRKWAVVASVSVFAAGGMTMSNSIGTLLPTFIQYYSQVEGTPPSVAEVTRLATYPSLFMGIGAIISVIAAQWIGTRVVFLLDIATTLGFSIWAALSSGGKDRGLQSHIIARAIASMGVGSVESLIPLILQDTNYIHTRNTRLSVVWSIGGFVDAALGATSTFIVQDRSWRIFYYILIGIIAVSFVMVIVIVPESSWKRTPEDLAGVSSTDENGFALPVRNTGRPSSYKYSLRLISEHCSAKDAWKGANDLVRCSLFPNIIWSVCLNATLIGTTISANNVIGNLLITGWHWESQNVGLLMVPLAVASIIVVPAVGSGGDSVVKWLARRNDGLHEPEHQLVNLAFPITVGFVGSLCFGIVCEHPENYHWFLPMLFTTFQFFSLLSVNIITATYAVECFPDLAGSMLIMIGAYRNIVGYGLTGSTTAFVSSFGYLGCFGTYAAIQAFFAILGIPFYLRGRALRTRMDRWPIRHGWGTKRD